MNSQVPGSEGLLWDLQDMQQTLSLQWVLPVLEVMFHQLGACALHTWESRLAGVGHWDLMAPTVGGL